MSRLWMVFVVLAGCAGGASSVRDESKPAPGVSFCGVEEQGPPIWNGKPLEDRSTPANPKPASSIVLGAQVAGDQVVRLPDTALDHYKYNHVSKLLVEVRVCQDERGAVERVCMVTPPGHPAAADAVQKTISHWRFEPSRLAGRPVKVCRPIQLNYTISM